MLGGFIRVDITPPVGIPMGGNCREDVASRGVHDELYADIIILEEYEEKLVLIDLDWCEAPLDIIRRLKRKIVGINNISYNSICIHMSHTHSSPDTFGCLNANGISQITQEYIDKTAENIAAGISKAAAELSEVYIGAGKCVEDKVCFNRRILDDNGKLHMNWELMEGKAEIVRNFIKTEGPIDPDLNIIKFCSAEGKLKAILVNFTLHPAILVMQDWLFSKDFIWALEERIKDKYGEDVLVYFANGAEGDINHINISDNTQNRGWDEAWRIGNLLGEDIVRLAEGIKVSKVNELTVLYKSIHIPVREISGEQIKRANEVWKQCGGILPDMKDGLPEEWFAASILRITEEEKKTRELELHAFKVGYIVIATLPGEAFVEYGLELKENSPYTSTLVFGLANQSIGYIPTKRAFENGGYETVTSEFSLLIPEAGDIIVSELLKMIETLEQEN